MAIASSRGACTFVGWCPPMKLRSVDIQNFRAIASLRLPLDPYLTVLHGRNANGKTSVLAAIAVGLGIIPTLLAGGGGKSFSKLTDVRNNENTTTVELETSDGLRWSRAATRVGGFMAQHAAKATSTQPLRDLLKKLADDLAAEQETTLPVFAFYDTDRAVFDLPERKRAFRNEFTRLDAYSGALEAKPSFKSLIEWFYALENNELREQRRLEDTSFRLPALEAVRSAIIRMLPDVTNPHIEPPVRFVVQRSTGPGNLETLSLDQLSGGYRIVLAMAADLARRMALGNPHLTDPLSSEAIVLIDEIELHLHPEWQQRIIGDLRRTFPNAQFIVSTHSPQVLTTVQPQHIVRLRSGQNGVEALATTGPTFGAESGDVLSAEMGVDERPINELSTKLERYLALIDRDEGEGQDALALRVELVALSPNEPALAAADVAIERRKLLRSLANQQ